MSLPLRPSTRSSESSPLGPAAPRPVRTFPGEVPPGNRGAERLEPIIDAGHVRDLLTFPLRAVVRHRGLALGVGGGMTVLTILAAVFMPRTYGVMTMIVAQKNIVMPALDNPKRTVPPESDAPTNLASEAVMSRDNLESIVRQTDLLSVWARVRSPLGLVHERVSAVLHGPMADSDRVEMLVQTLQSKLWVATNEGTVSIGINAWPDAISAQRIVQVAQQNFLEERHSTEMSMIGESIAILERHVESSQEAIEQALTDLAQVLGPAARRSADTAPHAPPQPAPPRHTAEIAGLQAELAAKRNAIQDVEESRTQALATLHVRLDQLRSQYGPAHPEITATLQDIQELSGDSPQLVKLRNDAKDLESQLLALGAVPGASPSASPLEPVLAREALERLARDGRADSLEDPRITYAKSRLKIAVANYEDLLDRLEGARIELETARAAFKYRYTVVSPPEVPKQPMKPNVPILVCGGFALAIVLAVFVATALDVFAGRIFEPWQIERQLGLPVFGTVHQP